MASTSTPISAESSTGGATNLDGDTNESKFTYAKASRGVTSNASRKTNLGVFYLINVRATT